ncbi:MAG: hypothetical protein V4850_33385 [Myxococcota bacterium]
MRLLLLLAAGLALAQAPATPSAATPGSAATASTASPNIATPGTADGPRPDRAAFDAAVVRSLDLPLTARKLRDAGVPEADVRGSLGAMRDAGVSAGDATNATEATVAHVKENGPVDNFGAFVQERLASGLRGQELAAAIAAEHQARGKGKKGGEHGAHGNEGHGDKDHGDKGHDDKGHDDKGHGDKGHGDKGHGDKSDAKGARSSAPGAPPSDAPPRGKSDEKKEK